MASRMLINATQAEEVRVALVNGSRLDNLDIEIHGKEQQKANIYKGKITRIEPSLEAVFVDYGAERHGFLPFREISRIYHRTSQNPEVEDKIPMREKISEGQEIIIQVEKESRGNKGAALTTYISLAGCYLVLMPNNPKAGGISRRIDGEERAEIREVLNQLQIPEDMGVIVRTAGMGRDIKDLQWDLDVLVQQWRSIEKAATERSAPFLIYQESNLVVRAIRDHLRPDVSEILVDSPKVYEDAAQHIRMMRPDFISRLKLYNDSIPLFSRFQIESQIEMAFQREVTLPSGGAIVIDHTEALISIDINSAKSTKGGDIEETAYETNLEAADEIARQLRLRDIGGLIVIDFIDMNIIKNQRAVEQRLKEALEMDRARVQVGRISRFGLLEMSRQRLRPALSAARDVICPRCSGQGTISSVEVLAINMVRLIEEEALKENTAQVQLEVPNEVATYLINEKRQAIYDIERKHHVKVVLLPSQYLNTPTYNLKRLKKDDSVDGQDETASYNLASKPDTRSTYNKPASQHKVHAPAVASFNPNNLPPQKTGLIRRVLSSIFGSEDPVTTDASEASKEISSAYKHPVTKRNPQTQRNSQAGQRNSQQGQRNSQQGQRDPLQEQRNPRNNRNNNRNRNNKSRQQHAEHGSRSNEKDTNLVANQSSEVIVNQTTSTEFVAAKTESVTPNFILVPQQSFEETTSTAFNVTVESNDAAATQPVADTATHDAANVDQRQQNNRKRTGHRRHQYRKGRYRNKRPVEGANNTPDANSAAPSDVTSHVTNTTQHHEAKLED
jgi:ribonuclease E